MSASLKAQIVASGRIETSTREQLIAKGLIRPRSVATPMRRIDDVPTLTLDHDGRVEAAREMADPRPQRRNIRNERDER